MENNIMNQSAVISKPDLAHFNEAMDEYRENLIGGINNIISDSSLGFEKASSNRRKETTKIIVTNSIPLISAFIFSKKLKRKHNMKLRKIAPLIRIKAAITSSIISAVLNVIAIKVIDKSNL